MTFGARSCGCPSLQGALGAMGSAAAPGAAELCNTQPGAWVVLRDSGGRCWATCIYSGERFEVECEGGEAPIPTALTAGTAGAPVTQGAGSGTSWIPGLSNNTLLMLGGGLLLLVLISRR